MTYMQFRRFAQTAVNVDTDVLFLCGEAQLGCVLKHDGQELIYELVDDAETPRKVLERAQGGDGRGSRMPEYGDREVGFFLPFLAFGAGVLACGPSEGMSLIYHNRTP